jgi:hypothetical protein
MSRAWTMAIAVAFLAGCEQDLEFVEITALTTPPLEATISGEEVVLVQGNAVAVQVRAFAGRDTAEKAEISLSPTPGMTVFEQGYPGIYGEDDVTGFILAGEDVTVGELRFSCDGTKGEVSVPFSVIAGPK